MENTGIIDIGFSTLKKSEMVAMYNIFFGALCVGMGANIWQSVHYTIRQVSIRMVNANNEWNPSTVKSIRHTFVLR